MNFELNEMCTRLKELRKKNTLTQEELSEKIHISPKHYGKYERGNIRLSLDILVDLANIYNVTTDYILKGTQPTPGLLFSEYIQACLANKQEALLEIVKTFIDSVSEE